MLEEIKNLTSGAGMMLLEAGMINNTAVTVSKEGRGEYVTQWDLSIEKTLKEDLLTFCPEAGFLGEEGGKTPPELESGWCFIVDPIDGTNNFIRGLRKSAVSVALAYKKEIRFGVICDPYQGELFYAEKGKGAFCNETALAVSKRPLRDSVVMFGTSSYDRNFTDITFKLLRALFDAAEDLRCGGSAALDICYVAAGRADVYFEFQLSPWDHAAASLILSEAGGRIETLEGKAPDLTAKSSIIAAPPPILEDIKKLGILSGIGK